MCEALRDSPNVGSVLKKQSHSFLALAQCFQKSRSRFDHDAVVRWPSPPYKRRRSNSGSRRRGDSSKRTIKYPKGVALLFKSPQVVKTLGVLINTSALPAGPGIMEKRNVVKIEGRIRAKENYSPIIIK